MGVSLRSLLWWTKEQTQEKEPEPEQEDEDDSLKQRLASVEARTSQTLTGIEFLREHSSTVVEKVNSPALPAPNGGNGAAPTNTIKDNGSVERAVKSAQKTLVGMRRDSETGKLVKIGEA